jgi:predicted ferric reductase
MSEELTQLKMRQHPLFTNRYRVLAVPTSFRQRQRQQSRIIWQNLLVATLIIFLFGLGATLTNPDFPAALANLLAQSWVGLLQTLFGQELGSGLSEKSPWISARVGGIMAYLLLFASVALGTANKLRLLDRLCNRATVMYLHRFISLAAFLFTGLHVGGLMLDTYLKFDLMTVLLPFSSGYRPLWTGLGTLAVYGALAVALTAYLAKRLGYRVWRTVHYLSFGIFVATFMHGLMDGSDSKTVWMQTIYLTTGAVVTFLIGVRFFKPMAANS